VPQIIPTIIAKSFDEVKEKIELVEPFVETVQLDVMDGIFVRNSTWQNPEDLNSLETNVELEAHLMIEKLHWEAMENIHAHELVPYQTSTGMGFPFVNLVDEVRKKGKQIGIALNPGKPIDVLEHFITEIDMVLLMSVEPGFGGQKFKEETLGRIARLREKFPSVKIEVDGGVNEKNIGGLVKAGADMLAVGSAIFGKPNIKVAVENLKSIINEAAKE
jgi:ribulose-phosphate 3-epimerase